MNLSARTRANRRNAARSKGPKTAAGKARVARNALRHGLAVALAADDVAPQIEALARRLCSEDAAGPQFAHACAIAEAQLDLLRVRRARRALLAGVVVEPRDPTPDGAPTLRADVESDRTLGKAIDAFARLDRYERRALSRRKFAIRSYDAFRCATTDPSERQP